MPPEPRSHGSAYEEDVSDADVVVFEEGVEDNEVDGLPFSALDARSADDSSPDFEDFAFLERMVCAAGCPLLFIFGILNSENSRTVNIETSKSDF